MINNFAIISDGICPNSPQRFCFSRIYKGLAFEDNLSYHPIESNPNEIIIQRKSEIDVEYFYCYRNNSLSNIGRRQIDTNIRQSFNESYMSLFKNNKKERENVVAFVDSCFLNLKDCSYTCYKILDKEYFYDRVTHLDATMTEYFGILKCASKLEKMNIKGNILTDSLPARDIAINNGVYNVLWVPREDKRIQDVDMRLREYIHSRSHLV